MRKNKIYLFLPFKGSLLFLFLLTGICNFSFAQAVRGKVYDDGTGEPLTGATVKIQRGDFKQSALARLDGSYVFKGLHTGTYAIKVSFLGYRESKAYEVTLGDAGETLVPDILLQNSTKQLSEVVVTGTASKETDQSARGLEKNAGALENILSQNTIQLLPDVTVGSAL
jgi:hypothetical protein